MKKYLLVLFSIIFVFIFCMANYAELKNGGLYVDPFTGIYEFDKSQKLNIRSYYGVRLGFDITKNISLEGMVGYVPTESEQNRVQNSNVRFYNYGLSALYNFELTKRWIPYVVMGASSSSMYNPDNGISEYHCYVINYGVGIRYFANDHIAIRTEFRENNFWRNDDFKRNQEYTIGITYYFGSKIKDVNKPDCETKIISLIPLVSTHFKFDSTEITEHGEWVLDENVETLKKNPNVTITINGYASPDGDFNYNQKLSERRASSVKDYMVSHGITSDRLIPVGKGIVKFEKEINRDSREARNSRRVTFEVNN